MWDLKNKTNEQIQQNRNIIIDTENKQVVARGAVSGGGKKQVRQIRLRGPVETPAEKQMSHGYEMYSVGNIVSNCNISVWWHIITTHCDHHFEMHRNIESLCCVMRNNIVLQVNYTSKTSEQIDKKKRSIYGYQRWVCVEEWWMKAVKKVQTFSYKINWFQGCNVQHDKYN